MKKKIIWAVIILLIGGIFVADIIIDKKKDSFIQKENQG